MFDQHDSWGEWDLKCKKDHLDAIDIEIGGKAWFDIKQAWVEDGHWETIVDDSWALNLVVSEDKLLGIEAIVRQQLPQQNHLAHRL